MTDIIELIVLVLTLLVVAYYTRETYYLRKASQEQARLFQRQVDITHQFRADPFKQAVYLSAVHGLMEIGTTVAELMAERDAVKGALGSHNYGAAHEKVAPKLKHLEALRMKWFCFLPIQFISEVDKFSQAYKQWMTAIKDAHVEGVELSVEIGRTLEECKRNMIKVTERFTQSRHLLNEADQIFNTEKR